MKPSRRVFSMLAPACCLVGLLACGGGAGEVRTASDSATQSSHQTTLTAADSTLQVTNGPDGSSNIVCEQGVRASAEMPVDQDPVLLPLPKGHEGAKRFAAVAWQDRVGGGGGGQQLELEEDATVYPAAVVRGPPGRLRVSLTTEGCTVTLPEGQSVIMFRQKGGGPWREVTAVEDQARPGVWTSREHEHPHAGGDAVPPPSDDEASRSDDEATQVDDVQRAVSRYALGTG